VRYLPIQYWISDKKRFSKEESVSLNPSIHFLIHRFFLLNNILKETKNVNYMISNINGYSRILNKLFDINISSINGFFARRFKASSLSKLNIYDDLLLNRKTINKEILPSFENIDFSNEIVLLTNTRMESPALNSFLFKNSGKYTFTSFSSFSSNIQKSEIPLSNYTVNASLQGFYNLKNKTIITSCINTLPEINLENVITLTPRYLNRSTSYFNNLVKANLNIVFSARSKKMLQPIFLTNNYNQSGASLVIGQNTFDQFILKQVNHKFLTRLFLLASIIKPTQKQDYIPISLLQKKINHDQSVLFQTTKTI